MMLFTLVILLLSIFYKVQSFVVNTSATSFYTYCNENDEPLQLTNPFPELSGDLDSVVNSDTFVEMFWSRTRADGEEEKLIKMVKDLEVLADDIEQYNVWGLQVNNVRQSDSAVYTCIWASTLTGTNKHKINVTIEIPGNRTDCGTSDEVTCCKRRKKEENVSERIEPSSKKKRFKSSYIYHHRNLGIGCNCNSLDLHCCLQIKKKSRHKCTNAMGQTVVMIHL